MVPPLYESGRLARALWEESALSQKEIALRAHRLLSSTIEQDSAIQDTNRWLKGRKLPTEELAEAICLVFSDLDFEHGRIQELRDAFYNEKQHHEEQVASNQKQSLIHANQLARQTVELHLVTLRDSEVPLMRRYEIAEDALVYCRKPGLVPSDAQVEIASTYIRIRFSFLYDMSIRMLSGGYLCNNDMFHYHSPRNPQLSLRPSAMFSVLTLEPYMVDLARLCQAAREEICKILLDALQNGHWAEKSEAAYIAAQLLLAGAVPNGYRIRIAQAIVEAIEFRIFPGSMWLNWHCVGRLPFFFGDLSEAYQERHRACATRNPCEVSRFAPSLFEPNVDLRVLDRAVSVGTNVLQSKLAHLSCEHIALYALLELTGLAVRVTRRQGRLIRFETIKPILVTVLDRPDWQVTHGQIPEILNPALPYVNPEDRGQLRGLIQEALNIKQKTPHQPPSICGASDN